MGFLAWFRRPAPAPVSAPRTAVSIIPAVPLRRPVAGSGFARSYLAAQSDRLVADLPSFPRAANADIRPALRILRARSRHLAQNNDYAKKYLRLVRNNVAGPNGFALQLDIRDPDGVADDAANKLIADAFLKFSKKGQFTVCGKHSRAAVERLVAESVARDGEALIRLVRGWKGNRFRFAVQLLEPDHLDEELNVPRGGGAVAGAGYVVPADHEIRMGVEFDAWEKPVAYFILSYHPGDEYYQRSGRAYTRVPADQIVHAFVGDRLSRQARGVPQMHAGLRRLGMLNGYEEAELVAARVGASKMGFYKSKHGEAEDVEGDADEGGEILEEMEPGKFSRLPDDVDFEAFDPQHPTDAFDKFVKAMLRGFASGVGVGYNALANDAEGVNYSSLRHFTLDERDEWRVVQSWVVDEVCEPIFGAWLEMALTVGAINLPLAKFDKFNLPTFQGRGWQWVDPEKEVNAEREAIALGVRSRTQIARERGIDLEQVFRDRQIERELAKKYGVTLVDPTPGSKAPPTPAPAPNQE